MLLSPRVLLSDLGKNLSVPSRLLSCWGGEWGLALEQEGHHTAIIWSPLSSPWPLVPHLSGDQSGLPAHSTVSIPFPPLHSLLGKHGREVVETTDAMQVLWNSFQF